MSLLCSTARTCSSQNPCFGVNLLELIYRVVWFAILNTRFLSVCRWARVSSGRVPANDRQLRHNQHRSTVRAHDTCTHILSNVLVHVQYSKFVCNVKITWNSRSRSTDSCEDLLDIFLDARAEFLGDSLLYLRICLSTDRLRTYMYRHKTLMTSSGILCMCTCTIMYMYVGVFNVQTLVRKSGMLFYM